MAVFGDGTRPAPVHFGANAPAELTPKSPAEVQLVACTERVDTGDPVKTCAMEGKNVPLLEATYEVTVYEARTRRVVATLTLVGESTRCPFIVTYREGTDPEDYTEVTPEQYAPALQPLTSGAAKPFID